MRLLFLGDISVNEAHDTHAMHAVAMPEADLVLANLEGPIVADRDHSDRKVKSKPALYNSPHVLDVLHAYHIQAVYLANNHLYDLPLPASHTQEILERAGIDSFGAGSTIADAGVPFTFHQGETKILMFSFGWNVIGCRPASPQHEGVNPLTPEHALQTIQQVRRTDTESFVIYVFHWNYELELYPQPADRQLAHALLHAGVDAIIGLHPHVAHGAERVGDKVVIYSLGNWFFPPRQVGSMQLAFPSIAWRQLAVELDISGRTLRAVTYHWYDFEPNTATIMYHSAEQDGGSIIEKLTPFANMSHDQYTRWFVKNRTKRKALPVYRDFRHTRRNQLKDLFVKSRQILIQYLVFLRLKGGPKA
jgi:hypothetical protein